jgi:hypothetical protein
MHKLLFPLTLIAIALSSACSAEVLNVGTNNPDNADGNPACAGVTTTPQRLFSPEADETVAIDAMVADGENVYLLQRSGDLANATTSPNSEGTPTLVRVPVAGGRRTLLAYDNNVVGNQLAIDAKHVYTVTGSETSTSVNEKLIRRQKDGQQLVSTRLPTGNRVYGLVANSLGWLAWHDETGAVLLRNPETQQITNVINGAPFHYGPLFIDDSYLYWDSFGPQNQLRRMALQGSQKEQLGEPLLDTQVDEQHLYGHDSQGGIHSRLKSSKSWRELFKNAPVVSFFRLNGDYLYWVGLDTLRINSLWRARKDGTGVPELLQRDLGDYPHVAIDQCRIYWTRETAAGQVAESRRK